jgi:hypothetical protein
VQPELGPENQNWSYAVSSHNTNASTKHQAERQEQAGSSSVSQAAWLGLAASGFWLLASHGLSLAGLRQNPEACGAEDTQQQQVLTQAASTSTKQSKSKPVAAQSGGRFWLLAPPSPAAKISKF